MNVNIADPLAGLLFGRDRTLVNLKLLRGDSPSATEHELRDEAHAGLMQALLGNCETHIDFPENSKATRIDVTALAQI